MASAPPVQPTPRPPKRPRLQQQDNNYPIHSQSPTQPQQQQQQQTQPQLPPKPPVPIQHVPPSNAHLDVYKPATGPRPGVLPSPRQSVLPSPAPSDEPSPAVSTSHESPHTAPASLPDLPPMNNQSSSAPNRSFTPRPILTSNTQVRQPSISGNQPNLAASSPAAASPHLPPTRVPSHITPNPASIPANHPFAPVPSQQSAGPPRQNMVSPNSSGPPQRDAPPRLAPPGQPNPRQQPAMQTWMPTGNMANQRIPGQSSPSLHGYQPPFSPPKAGQQVFSNPAMNQQYPPQQMMYQQQAQPQQPQLPQQQNVAQPPTQYQQPQLAATHRMMGQNLQAPNQTLQYSQGTRQPSSVRTAIPTPGVSPVAAQFPGGIRGQQQPFVSQQPVQSVMSPGIPSPNAPAQVAKANARQQLQQQQRQQIAQGAGYPRFIPPPNHAILLCDFPTGPEDRKAIMMSLHQAEVRSPRRKVRAPATGGEGDERYYQAVMSLAVPPARIPPAKVLHKFYFEVPDEEFSRASQIITQGATLPVATHFNGSLRWRVRTTKLKPKKKFDDIHEWSCADMDWPLYITLNLNGNNIQIRRKPHNGRDQPAELTPFITKGRNELLVAVAVTKDPPADQFALAVEIVETRSHASIMDHIWTHGVIPEENTLNKIKRRVTGTQLDDDSIAVVQPEALSIDVADPFTRAMWQIPVRGAACTHMECFDLSIWLETRPSKTVRCPHSSFTKCGCNDQREPSVVDKWKCPICEGDARPYSLKIDGFLLKVRQELERAGKIKAKRIQAAPDGTWRAEVEEDSDDDDDDSDGDGARQKSASKGPAVPKKPVEVIDLLDD
ncbi:hypothetical protein GE09DRAFT_1178234 [Coniochaeta sp. 2T2.1]|nr:hypothetical protein GE09DRAFT_1178234 [Coniochaeta sp. 2T2.1]